MGWELGSRPRRENSKGKNKIVVLFFKSQKVRLSFKVRARTHRHTHTVKRELQRSTCSALVGVLTSAQDRVVGKALGASLFTNCPSSQCGPVTTTKTTWEI